MVGTNIVDPTALIVNFLPPFGWLLVICLGQTLLDLRQLPSPKNFEVFSRRNSNDLSWFEMSDNLKSTGWAKSRGVDCPMFRTETLDTINCISPFATVDLISLFFRYPSHGTNESHTRMTTPTDYYNTTPVDGIENTHHLTAIYPLLFLLLEWGAEMLSLSFVSSQNAVMKTKSTTNTLVIDLYALAFYLMFGSIYLQTLAVKTDMR